MTFDLYFAKNQYGLRKQHSTKHAILEGVDRLGSTMDNENIPIAIFLELSKAFDILDHKIITVKITVLWHQRYQSPMV